MNSQIIIGNQRAAKPNLNVRRNDILGTTNTTTGRDEAGSKSQLNHYEAKNYQVMRQLNHQFTIAGKLEQMRNDLRDSEVKRSQKMEMLRQQESRIEILRNSLADPRNVEREVDLELNSLSKRNSSAAKCGGEVVTCMKCGEKFLQRLFSSHDKYCSSVGRDPQHQSQINAQLTCLMEPQPPRNVVVSSIGHNFLVISWNPPILDGGNAIYDYEISFKECHLVTIGKRKAIAESKYDTMTCSIWCLKNPIPSNSFCLDSLRANTEYQDIQIRCRNSIGWSAFSSAVTEKIVTSQPRAPSLPLFVKVSDVTCSTIKLNFSPPADSGGVSIGDYELRYIEVVPKDTRSAEGKGMLKEKTEDVQYLLKIGGPFTDFVLRNLRGNTLFKSIQLTAINEAGLCSKHVKIPDQKTKEASRWYLVRKEIERVTNQRQDFIDTDFYQGIVQRRSRLNYLNQLNLELSTLPPDIEYVDCELHSQGASYVSANDAAQGQGVLPGQKRRKDQFLFRINAIKEEINQLKIAKESASEDLVFLSSEVEKIQQRTLELHAEVDRASTFSGISISSSVIHGTLDQSFTVDQLVDALYFEIERCQEDISSKKGGIIETIKTQASANEAILTKTGLLKERKAAFFHFEQCTKQGFIKSTKAAQTRKSRPPKNINEMLRIILKCWLELSKRQMKISNLWCKIVLRRSWSRWNSISNFIYQAGAEKLDVASAAGALLLEAGGHRSDQVNSAFSILESVVSLKKVNGMHGAQINNSDDLFSFNTETTAMLQGDAYVGSGYFEHALRCYYAQLSTLQRDDSFEGQVKLMATLHGRIGRTEVHRENWNLAILNFERQKSVSETISDTAEKCSALLGLGSCYVGRGEFDNAKCFYDKALHLCTESGDDSGMLKAHRGLQSAYNKVSDRVNACKNKVQADSIEFKTSEKIMSGLKAMDNLKSRLIRTSAVGGREIHLEKSSILYIKMKTDERRIINAIEEEKVNLVKAGEDTAEIERYCQRISEELDLAKSSNGNISTSLVHGNQQTIDAEELAIRLYYKLEETKEQCSEQREVGSDIRISIGNLQDDLKTLHEDMEIERGPLMSRVLASRTFRCVGLNISNSFGNEVCGTATGGVELLVASEDKHIYIFDIHTGELTHAFQGANEDKGSISEANGHTGIICTLFFRGIFVYSGSMDKTIMCWNVKTKRRVFTARGHEATVTSLFIDETKMVSGSADTNIIVWNKESGSMIRRVQGHSRGVLTIQSGPTWILSGDQDGYIHIWTNTVLREDPLFTSVICKTRLFRLDCKVTVARKGNLEIISGHGDGTIVIWWMKTGEILHKYKAHTGAVRALHFDSTRVVSCGTDMNIQIADSITGELIQSLRCGQENVDRVAHILGLTFDSKQLLSASADGNLKFWPWQTMEMRKRDRVHLFNKGDTFAKLSKDYSVTVNDLMKWNNISDMKKLFIGKKLVVKKADPNMLTEAEISALRKSRKEKRVLPGRMPIKKVASTTNGVTSSNWSTETSSDDVLGKKFDPLKDSMKKLEETLRQNGIDPSSLSGRLKAETNPENLS